MKSQVVCRDIENREHPIASEKLVFRPSAYGLLIEDNKILLTKQVEKISGELTTANFENYEKNISERFALNDCHSENFFVIFRVISVYSIFNIL